VSQFDGWASKRVQPYRGVASVTSDSIRFRQFSLVRRGFSPDEVRSYLVEVANWFDGLKLQVVQLTDQLQKLQRKDPGQPRAAAGADPYGDLGARMAEVLRSVDQHAQQLRGEVEEEAGRRAAEAQTEAERIQREAQTEAERLHREARETLDQAQAKAEWTRMQAQDALKEVREDAARVLTGLAERRTLLLSEVHGLLELMGNIRGQFEKELASLEAGGPEAMSAPEPTEGQVDGEMLGVGAAANGTEPKVKAIDLGYEFESIDLGRS
jgi:cell division septum initiation protein DivIVA